MNQVLLGLDETWHRLDTGYIVVRKRLGGIQLETLSDMIDIMITFARLSH
jgi:hypothetical protein